MATVEEIFNVGYGNKLDMNKQEPSPSGIAFVGRKGANQGVSGRVQRIDDEQIYPAGALTVALGGSRLLACFVQQEPFYTAQNVAVLQPRDKTMPLNARLFYAMAITANRYRYTAFGREANRTIRSIDLPDRVPDWVSLREEPIRIRTELGRFFSGTVRTSAKVRYGDLSNLDEIFHIQYGQSLELNRLKQVPAPHGVNFVSRTSRNNGVTARVESPQGVLLSQAGTLSVSLSGAPLSAFLQPEPYVCGFHVAVLTPRSEMATGELLWWSHVIRANAFRYSYGRQANRTIAGLKVPTEIPQYAAAVCEAACRDELFPSQKLN